MMKEGASAAANYQSFATMRARRAHDVGALIGGHGAEP